MDFTSKDYKIVERFIETRIDKRQIANLQAQVVDHPMFNEIAVRLRAKMLEEIVWYNEVKNDPVVAPGIWNNIKEALPAKLAIKLGGVMLVDTFTEHHLHHACPHIPLDSPETAEKAHFDWLERMSK